MRLLKESITLKFFLTYIFKLWCSFQNNELPPNGHLRWRIRWIRSSLPARARSARTNGPEGLIYEIKLSQLTQTLGERIHLTSCELLSQLAAGTAILQALALTLASAANYRVLRWIPL